MKKRSKTLPKLHAIVHASELITGDRIAAKDGRRLETTDLDRRPDGALVYSLKRAGKRWIPHRIVWVGATADLPKKYAKISRTNLKGEHALIPGLVDCHTHLVFAGDRSDEFARRAAGATYQEIAREGGGIQKTVISTKKATLKELVRLGTLRLKRMRELGARTIEIKSGYGLEKETELKQLEAVRHLQAIFPDLTLVPTYMGAHDLPPEQKSGAARRAFIQEIIDVQLPLVAKKGLAHACDIFVDEGYFDASETRQILSKAKFLGMDIKIHADELTNTETTALAVELGAKSADHLLKISEAGVAAIAPSQTVAVLLPGTAFYLKAEYAPARRLLEAGACVAISTDFNPGSCNSLSLPFMMSLSALYMKMSAVEIFSAVTYAPAKALGLEKRKGSLEVGKDADFVILEGDRFEQMYYRVAW